MKKLNQNGVTLLALVITIVVLLILASVATYSGIDIIRSSRLNTFTAEMKIMQTEVNNLYEQWKSGEINIDENTGNITKQENGTTISIGKDLTYNSTVEDQATYVLINELSLGSSLSDLKGYKYFDYETIENLGIEGTEGEFLVSIEDRKVVSYEGLRYDGVIYYTLEQLPQSLYNVEYNPTQGEPTFDLSYEKIGDNEWKITISNIQYDGYIDKWYVKYQQEGQDYWNETEDMSFVVNNREIYNVTIENGDVKSTNEKIYVYEPNEPKLSSGMIPIKWINNNWVICSEDDIGWYNYVDQQDGVDGTSKWANVMLSDGKYYAANSTNVDKTGKELATVGQVVAKEDLGSMFVWIPRYAYQIESGYHSSEAGKINVAFLKENDKYATGDSIYYNTQEKELSSFQLTNASGQGNWNEHPAFTYGDTTIEGIWVAKFEASSSNPSATNGGGNVTNLNVKILPEVTNWRGITIGNSYTNCVNMNNEDNAKYYGISTNDNEIDPHLMKNSEWGAIAYLTQSSYGRNQNEITVNDNSEYITGDGDYKGNKNQSTTGNETGIYDMSGGAWERVAGYVNNGHDNSKTYAQELLSAPEKHKQVYEAITSDGSITTTGNDSQQMNYEKMSEIYGDAVYETSSSHSGYTSWQENSSNCPYMSDLFFVRGGSGLYASSAGMFYFRNANGIEDEYSGFRPVFAI